MQRHRESQGAVEEPSTLQLAPKGSHPLQKKQCFQPRRTQTVFKLLDDKSIPEVLSILISDLSTSMILFGSIFLAQSIVANRCEKY